MAESFCTVLKIKKGRRAYNKLLQRVDEQAIKIKGGEVCSPRSCLEAGEKHCHGLASLDRSINWVVQTNVR